MPDAPRYFAYSLASGRIQFTCAGSDENSDYRRSVVSDSSSIGESSDLDQLVDSLHAHFGRQPDDTIYIVDADQTLVRTLRCEKYDEVVSKLYKDMEWTGRWACIGWCLFVFCVISFVISAIIETPVMGVVVFAFTATIYLTSTLLHLANEVESAFIAFIILILLCLLLPAVQRAREAAGEAQRRKQTTMLPAPRDSVDRLFPCRLAFALVPHEVTRRDVDLSC